MKKDNIIMIICDSMVFEENLLEKLPSINKYKDNMYEFTNYYSEGPYTEAAIVPILSSSRILDYGGYLHNLKNRPKNINEIFQEIGFKTYNTLFFYANSLSFLRGLDEYDYMDTPTVISHFTAFRLAYYTKLYNEKQFTDDHRKQFIDLVSDLFSMIEIYLEDYKNHKHRLGVVIEYTEVEEFIAILQKEYKGLLEMYESDVDDFIDKMLTGKLEFFKATDIPVKKSKEFFKIEKDINKFIRYNTIHNIKNAIKFRKENDSVRVLKYILKEDGNSFISGLMQWAVRMNNYGKNFSYNRISAKVIFDRQLEYLKENQDNKNFSYLHLHENHNPLNYLSIEKDSIKEEFKVLKDNKRKNKNTTFYDYSIEYVDEKINEFLENVDKELGMDNVTIIITADHGTNLTSKIYRDVNVMNFKDESFHIPLYIINKELEHKVIDNYGSSSQLTATIIDTLNLEYDKEWVNEMSLLQNNKDEIIFEYYGPGTPDYTLRDKLLCIRSHEYKVEYKVTVENEGSITGIYDLVNDPMERVNKKDELSELEEVKDLVAKLQVRIDNIIV